MRKLSAIGAWFCLFIFIILMSCSLVADKPNSLGFGDSWLKRSNLDVDKHMLGSINFSQMYQLIKLHPDGDYKTVVILGGIGCHLYLEYPIDKCDLQLEKLKRHAEKKFPNSIVVVISAKHILETLALYDSGDGRHTTQEGYDYLFQKYPDLAALRKP